MAIAQTKASEYTGEKFLQFLKEKRWHSRDPNSNLVFNSDG